MSTMLGSTAKLVNLSKSLMTKSVSRNFHSTGTKKMGGGHGHGRNEPYYVHGEHMYDLDKMKNQKVKIPMAVSTVFFIGILVPI